MKLSNKSLQFKLTALIATIVLSLGFGFLGVMNYLGNHEEASIREGVKNTAVALDEAISAQFFERYGDIQAFALNPDLQASSREVVSTALNNYVTLYGIYDLILIADAEGRIVGVNTKDPSGKDIKTSVLYGRSVKDEPWFKQTIAGNFTEDKQKNFLGTYVEGIHLDAMVSEIYGDKRVGNGFSAQIKDSKGNVIGVVTNRAGSRWIEGAISDTHDKLVELGFTNGRTMVTTEKGVVVAAVDPFHSKGSLEPSRDFNYILKHNLLANQSPEAVSLLATKSAGSAWGFNKDQNVETAVGFSPMKGKKFIESLGWNVVVEGPRAEAKTTVLQLQKLVYTLLAIAVVTALAFATFFSIWLSSRLRKIAVEITNNSGAVGQMAEQMAETSSKLSASTTEQAAALQETVSSVDEVSAMVAKNADNAKRSKETSGVSTDAAQRGKQVVDEMITSIEDINQSNTQIMKQIEDGNTQFAEIIKVITEIGSKTKVINDIVFQTKLLSFNASVEAARAGEHGKGFAVVAEEVGNLAQMSGNAAKEISQMLDGSIQRVEQIVNETKSRVDRLMADSKVKVETGTVTARRCGQVLDDIVKNVSEVNLMVSEIATASNEQSQGVNEINKAMNQLDQVTQANAASSQEAAATAEQLRGQSAGLSEMVQDLMLTVDGASGKTPSFQSVSKPAASLTEGVGKILSFNKPKAKAAPRPAETKLARASGSDVVPSREDDRFEEV